MSIYSSDWNPRGVRKDWERCSIGSDSAQQALGMVEGKVTDACAWFDGNGNLRVMVADADDGKRLTYRRNVKGVTIEIAPAHTPSTEQASS